MNTPPRFPTAPRGHPVRAIKQDVHARRHNKAPALLTFLGCVGYAPSVELGIVVGTGVALAIYFLRP
ncbi:MAG: hypothetical protein K0M66_02980 [Thiobacillus sp.]|nr:hypothetical protein [Thiobacillus sp.]